ncbi:hypothetical protein DFQ26_003034 [Actinomortierella ambigua]|nr:hypothetical protein DFQ26_003034 [Actinomortierella ambigua]
MSSNDNNSSNVTQRAVSGKKTTITTTTTRTLSGSDTPTVSTTKVTTTTSSSSGSGKSKTNASSGAGNGCLSVLKGLVAVVAIVGAVTFPFLKETATDLGLFLGPIVKVNTDLCRPVSSLESCEDVHIHRPSGLAIAACGRFETRKINGWFPPLGHLNHSADPLSFQDHIVLYNPEDGKHEVMDIENFPEGADRVFHGFDIYERSERELTLFFINHRRTGSVVEVIDYYVGETTMKYVQTIQHDLISTPNDIVALGLRSFYISNDHKYLSGPMRVIENNLRRAWSNVIYYSPEQTLVAYEGVSSANGMTANHDKSIIYVSACHGAGIHVMEPRDDHTLRERDFIKLDFYADNPSLDPVTGAIFLTGHTQPLKLLAGFNVPGEPMISPFKVIKISNNTGSDQFYGKKYKVDEVLVDDGTDMSGATTAAVDRERNVMLIGTLDKRGLWQCTIPKDA